MQKKFDKLSDLEMINQMLEQGMDDPEELDDFIFWFHQKSKSLSAD